ncbi:dicarboxylate/amino acid:cation symporter [bacterium]|nr:dicarboxylate/amino acid:cation symporter [bacterium]
MSLWKKVIIGLVLGVLLGFFLGDWATYLKPLGDIFIRLIKMIIIPLIFFSIVSGITNVKDTKTLGRLGLKSLFAFLVTTFLAITIGLVIGSILEPGSGLTLNLDKSFKPQSAPAQTTLQLFDTILNIVPDNAIGAMAQGTILQVVFFALFTGFTINTIKGEIADKISEFFRVVSAMVFQMVHLIVQLSPLAACFLTAWVVGSQGATVLLLLLKLVGCAYLGFFLQYLLFGALIWMTTGLSPLPFFKKSFEYQVIAFSTSSSKAALPTTMRVAKDNLGISQVSSSFVLPLGASINMVGIAIYISLAALFFAQALGKQLSFTDYMLIGFTGSLGSIGGAGIPSGTIVMLPLVLGAVGLPIEGIALILGIDRIVDMMRTTISITGDAAVALIVDYSEGLLNKNIYNSSQIIES